MDLVTAEGRLDAALDALNRALIELGEAQGGVEDCLRQLDFNPAELEALEERLFAIRDLARKHGVEPDALAAQLQDCLANPARLTRTADQQTRLRALLDHSADVDVAGWLLRHL